MNKPDSKKFFNLAFFFESSLILIAILLGWIADIDPFVNIHFSERFLFYGISGAALLFVIFIALYQIEITSLQKIRELLLQTFGPSMSTYHWTDLLVLAAIAGISEEILFRGVLQPWMEISWGPLAGLIGSNIVFGLVHAVTPLYAILAGLVGIFLGLSMDYGGQRNLLTPIIIHGLYDFLAFIVILRSYRALHQESNDQ